MLGWEGLGMAMFLVSYPNTVANWCGKVSDVHLVIVNPETIVCPVAAALLPGPWPGLSCRKFGRAWYIISRVMLDNRNGLVVCGALCSVQSYQ